MPRPAAKAADRAAINDLATSVQELGQRLALVERNVRLIERSLDYRIERLEDMLHQALVDGQARSERQHLELMTPLVTLLESFEVIRADVYGMRGVLRLDHADPDAPGVLVFDRREDRPAA